MIRAYLAIGLLIALICSHWYAYSAGVSREHDRNVAAASAQKDAVAGQVDQNAQSSATASTNMLDYLAAQKPAIEIRTHETTERIRTVYKDRNVPAACTAVVQRPDSVQAELDAARDRANAAIRSLPVGTPVASTADPGLAGNRPMGGNHDGAVRDSSDPPERHEQLFARSQG